MNYTNSSLVDYVKLSPNIYGNRNCAIDTITIHCVVGQLSIETIGNIFAKESRKASCNYAIGSDGRIALIVEEKNISQCSSSYSNDKRAITIEVASDTVHPYAVNDKAMDSLIKLCADICKRNGIEKLLWKADKSLIGKVNQQNMTVHRWFANKACPGDFLYNLHGEIADKVNSIIYAKHGWVLDEIGWKYIESDGNIAKNKWLKLDSWYYFDSTGYAVKGGWKHIDKKWYYFSSDCRMKTGWINLQGKYYYLSENGAMVTGIQEICGEKYFFADDGHMCITKENGALI